MAKKTTDAARLAAGIEKLADAFTSMLAALRPLYEAEIARLTDEYRPRILAGEFSGHTNENGGVENGDPRYMLLVWELGKKHPWCRSEPAGHLVLACSSWPAKTLAFCRKAGLSTVGAGEFAEDCMARDVLNLAAARGWVKRYGGHNEDHPYAVNAKPRAVA